MGLKKKNDYYDDYNGNNSNMKLVYVLVGLTVVTVALIVLLVLFLNGTFGGSESNSTPTPMQNTATPAPDDGTPEPSETPGTTLNGEMIILNGTITVNQVPTGIAPTFAMGTGDNLGSLIISNDNVYKGDLLLVNSTTAFDAKFSTSKIVNVFNESRNVINDPVNVSTSTVELEERALYALVTMLQKAEESGNTGYFVDSGYKTDSPEDLDYQTGLAYDIGFTRQEGQAGRFAELPQGQWMIENCYQYGFIQRYTAEKSSTTGMSQDVTHYRYVGFPHSLLMKQQNLCLEEYVDYVRRAKYIQVMTGEKLSHEILYFYADPTSADGKTVCPLTDTAYQAYSQGNASITVSGDNFGGFIVTVIYK